MNAERRKEFARLRRKIIQFVCLLALGIVTLGGFGAFLSPSRADAPSYVGSQTCTTCHQAQSDDWSRSHHALAWMLPSAENVLADFDDTVFEHHGITHRFTQRDGDYFMETDGPDGELVQYRLNGVAGVMPLQQYLFETEPGRLQSHDVTWDVTQARWYHLYPEQDLAASDGMHWTGPYKNWNSRCAECHSTGFEKRYTSIDRTYASRQAEIGVGCEACHGPGSTHVGWAAGTPITGGQNLTDTGFTAGFTAANPEAEIQQCAGCHSRREPLLAQSPLPGTPYHDSYRLALLREGLYHTDGAILEEVYVYGSFLQSKMYANGVRCTDCHNPHSGERRIAGNGLCTQCHSEAGNERFPSLPLASYDTADHHFHRVGSDGAQCVSCHMIERDYMQIDGRRDHSFRIPRPDLSEETGAPNACTDCHIDRDADWAAAEISIRYPDGSRRGPHFSQVFVAGRLFPSDNRDELMEIAEDTSAAVIVRATALEMLRGVADEAIANRSAALLANANALIRENAIGLQRGAAPADQVRRLAPLLEDPLRSVRVSAARSLIGVPPTGLPEASHEPYRNAMKDFQNSLSSKTDFPEAHLALGGAALVMRNPSAAEAAFREAVTLDPQLEEAWSMIVQIRTTIGDWEGARDAVTEAREHNPSSLLLIQLELSLRSNNGQ